MAKVISISRASVASLADEYGNVDCQIKRLQERKDALREEILSRDDEFFRWDGNKWRLNIIRQVRAQINWRGLAEMLGATEEQITRHTDYKDVTLIKTEALK